jgi:hypothetical protein
MTSSQMARELICCHVAISGARAILIQADISLRQGPQKEPLQGASSVNIRLES